MSADRLPEEGPFRAAPERRAQALELAAFLFLIIPSLVLSFFARQQGGVSFLLLALSTIFRDLSLVALVLFFVWRNREPVERIGWRWRHLAREVAIGVALFVPLFLGAAGVEWALQRAGLSAPKTPLPALVPGGGSELILALVLVAVVAVSEESIFRGYLILRFRGTTGSTAAAVLLSSAIFALGHGYEGSAGLVTVGLVGVAFALVYVWRKSLAAPITMHFLQDFLGIVLLPFLGAKH